MFKHVKHSMFSIALISGFVGCGSGGSSSSDSNSFSFPSTATESEPTIENGKKVKEVVATNQQSTYTINAVESTNSRNIAFDLQEINDIIKQKTTLSDYSLNETVNETESCSDGGTIHYSGSGNDMDGGTVTNTFKNCKEGGLFINGTIYSKIYNYNSVYDEFLNEDLKFITDTSITIDNINVKYYKGSTANSEITDFIPDEATSMKITINAIAEVNGKKSGQNNSIYYLDNLTSNPSMYQTQGKIYIDNLNSFVNYDTTYDMSQTPFVFNLTGLLSGEARYNMSSGGKVKIVVESNKTVTYVDVNGDGVYELRE